MGELKIKSKISLLIIVSLLIFSLLGCSSDNGADNADTDDTNGTQEEVTITLAAAASLKNTMDDELIPMFQEENSNIKVQATYDSSGKLQSQIEEGADIDVFMSAAMNQMNALEESGLVDGDSVIELLENKIVLIVPEGNPKDINSFEDILNADEIAIGDPESVPAGEYAEEVLTNLDLWDGVLEKASLGTNVTEVLNWVAEGSADVGIVYSTDAASNDNVEVVAEAPEEAISKVIYPIGMVSASENKDAAESFIEFLATDEALEIFESYGFTANE